MPKLISAFIPTSDPYLPIETLMMEAELRDEFLRRVRTTETEKFYLQLCIESEEVKRACVIEEMREHYSVKQIADLLGVTPEAVKKTLAFLRERRQGSLRRELY